MTKKFFSKKFAKIYGATFGLSPQKWGSLFRKNSLNLLKSSKIHGFGTFFGVSEQKTIRKGRKKCRNHRGDHRNGKTINFCIETMTQLFSTPKFFLGLGEKKSEKNLKKKIMTKKSEIFGKSTKNRKSQNFDFW